MEIEKREREREGGGRGALSQFLIYRSIQRASKGGAVHHNILSKRQAINKCE